MTEMAPVFTDITNQAPDSPTRKSFLDTTHKATKHRPPSLRLSESPAGGAPQSPNSSGLTPFNPATLSSSSIDIFEDSPQSMHSQNMQSPGTMPMMCSSPCTPANLIAPAMNQNGIYMPPGAPVRPRKWSNSQSSTPSQSPSPFGWAGFSPSATNPGVACALFSSPAGTPVSAQGMARPAFPMPLTPQQQPLSRQMSFGSLGSSNSQSGGSGSQPMVITPHSQQHPGFASALNEAPPPAPQKVLPPSAHSPITPIPMSTSTNSWV